MPVILNIFVIGRQLSTGTSGDMARVPFERLCSFVSFVCHCQSDFVSCLQKVMAVKFDAERMLLLFHKWSKEWKKTYVSA